MRPNTPKKNETSHFSKEENKYGFKIKYILLTLKNIGIKIIMLARISAFCLSFYHLNPPFAPAG